MDKKTDEKLTDLRIDDKEKPLFPPAVCHLVC